MPQVLEPPPERQSSMSTRAHLRAFVALLAAQRRSYGPGLVFVLIGIVTALSYPYAIRLTIDQGIEGHDLSRLNALGLLMLVLLLCEGVGTVFRDYFFNLGAERLAADVRHRAFAQLLRQDIAFFDRRTTGEITTRLAADVPTLQRISGDELADGLRFALWGIGGTAMLFYTSAVLSALVLIAMPTLVAGAYMLGGRIKRYTADAQHAYAQTGTIVEESIAGIRTVRAFSQEAAEAARHESLMSAAVGLARRKILATASHTGLSFIIGEGCALLALWVGGHLIINGTLSSGGLISFILYAFLVARGYRNASTFWAELLVALGSTEWVFGVMALEPELANLDGLRPAHLGGAVTFDAVHFSYPSRADVEALAGIDLAIAPGEVVAFVGRSGSGKSTLLNLLLRFYDPTRGRVLVDDVDLRRVDPVWLRGQVGVVMQEPVLFSRSIADNIRYGHPGAGDADVRDAARLAHADEFITRFPDGYATRVGDRGVQLSGGQRQRIAIARAVLRRPPVLMLDEATSALDAESESLVQDAIRGLDYRPTTLIVAHRLSTVVNVDRVVVVDRGRILAAGTHETLLESCEFYRQLVENQLVAA